MTKNALRWHAAGREPREPWFNGSITAVCGKKKKTLEREEAPDLVHTIYGISGNSALPHRKSAIVESNRSKSSRSSPVGHLCLDCAAFL
jgi:hypothetical protein